MHAHTHMHSQHTVWWQTPCPNHFSPIVTSLCCRSYLGYLDLYAGLTPVNNAGNLSDTTRTTTLYDNAAADFIRDHADSKPEEPFFMFYAHQEPHVSAFVLSWTFFDRG